MALYNYILNDTFSSITSFGAPVFYILVILILLKFEVSFALNLFLAFLFIELLCIVIKLIYRKERPVPQPKKEFFDKIDANSFPSVHSARISLLVTMVSLHYKDMLLFIIGIVIMLGVGYSRVYLKRHDYRDVLYGFLIGIVTAIIALHI